MNSLGAEYGHGCDSKLYMSLSSEPRYVVDVDIKHCLYSLDDGQEGVERRFPLLRQRCEKNGPSSSVAVTLPGY